MGGALSLALSASMFHLSAMTTGGKRLQCSENPTQPALKTSQNPEWQRIYSPPQGKGGARELKVVKGVA